MRQSQIWSHKSKVKLDKKCFSYNPHHHYLFLVFPVLKNMTWLLWSDDHDDVPHSLSYSSFCLLSASAYTILFSSSAVQSTVLPFLTSLKTNTEQGNAKVFTNVDLNAVVLPTNHNALQIYVLCTYRFNFLMLQWCLNAALY